MQIIKEERIEFTTNIASTIPNQPQLLSGGWTITACHVPEVLRLRIKNRNENIYKMYLGVDYLKIVFLGVLNG